MLRAANRRNLILQTSGDCTALSDAVRLRQFVAIALSDSLFEHSCSQILMSAAELAIRSDWCFTCLSQYRFCIWMHVANRRDVRRTTGRSSDLIFIFILNAVFRYPVQQSAAVDQKPIPV